jgi:hypothetical protein
MTPIRGGQMTNSTPSLVKSAEPMEDDKEEEGEEDENDHEDKDDHNNDGGTNNGGATDNCGADDNGGSGDNSDEATPLAKRHKKECGSSSTKD